jgi:hypothetical protein
MVVQVEEHILALLTHQVVMVVMVLVLFPIMVMAAEPVLVIIIRLLGEQAVAVA